MAATKTGQYFQLNDDQMHRIIQEFCTAVKDWRTLGSKLGIPCAELEIMAPAFGMIV